MLEHLDMEKTTNSHSEVDSEEDEEVSRILGKFMKKNSKKQKLGRKPQWTTILAKEVVDIILENDKFKEKSLLTNVKNSKNSQYYLQVIDELKDRCKQRDSIFTYGLNQTRQTFKRCVSICREAALKIKTTSGIRFQDEKEYGCWFKKLLEVVKSISNCQPIVIRPLSLVLQPAPIVATPNGKVLLTNLSPKLQRKDRCLHRYMRLQRWQKK